MLSPGRTGEGSSPPEAAAPVQSGSGYADDQANGEKEGLLENDTVKKGSNLVEKQETNK